MAFLEFKNVKIAGIAAGVPKNVFCNLEMKDISKDYDAAAFVELTGVKERRLDDRFTTSDLCVPAAEKLIADLGWDKKEIEALIFVSQTTDYYLPATSCIVQDRLGLSKECYTEDIVLGCSGWVYGLSNVVSLIANGGIKKALLMCGDAKRHIETNDPLFGHAGTVTAVEYAEGSEGFKFHYGTDGSGYNAIIIPDGGCRNVVNPHSFDMEEVEGKMMNRLQTHMNGMDVFSFGITTAPKSVKKLAEHYGFDYQQADYLLLHQANMKMNKMIAKKLKFEDERVPSCMYHFGNTSSASIPLTIATELKGKLKDGAKLLCCGFGVGLSWGTVYFEANNLLISNLVEVDETDGKEWV